MNTSEDNYSKNFGSSSSKNYGDILDDSSKLVDYGFVISIMNVEEVN